MHTGLQIALAIGCLSLCACGRSDVAVEYRDGYAWSGAERRAIYRVARLASRDVRVLLPDLSTSIRLTVQAGPKVIPETGETASVGLPTAVYWTVDPSHHGGVMAIVNAQLRATLFHEFYHLVRKARITDESPVERIIDEGLATAFERDFGGAPTPWGAYPHNVTDWVAEFFALPSDSARADWIARSPDGRRWFGFKIGTYLADRASKQSGLSLAQLATVPTADILKWGRQPP